MKRERSCRWRVRPSGVTESRFAAQPRCSTLGSPMKAKFTGMTDLRPGAIAALLRASYVELLKTDLRWEWEAANWDEYDREVFAHPKTVGACIFLTRLDERIVGFGSWDPRPEPAYAIIGHNCILPEFRGKGLGGQQIQEILRRFRALGIKTAKVSTHDHPLFVPAQHMYIACGFREMRRIPWERNPEQNLIEYEKDVGQPAGAGAALQRA